MYSNNRYTTETQRLLDVLDKHLVGKTYLVNEEYTIADIAWFPWVRCLDTGYASRDTLGLDNYKNVVAWLNRCLDRPGVQKALTINSLTGIPEYHSDAQ